MTLVYINFVYLQGENFILLFVSVLSLTGKVRPGHTTYELASTSDNFIGMSMLDFYPMHLSQW